MKKRKQKVLNKRFPALGRILLLLGIAVAFLGLAVGIFGKDATYVSEVEKSKVDKAYELLYNSLNYGTSMYVDYIVDGERNLGKGDYIGVLLEGKQIGEYENKADLLDYKESATYEVITEMEGYYQLQLDYQPVGSALSDFCIDVQINGETPYSEMKNIVLPLIWEDTTKQFPKDRYGDETTPNQVRRDEFSTMYLYNSTYSVEPLLFYLKKGANQIIVTNVSNDGLAVGELLIREKRDETKAYAEYKEEYSNKSRLTDKMITVDAINYVSKNTTDANLSSENNPVLTPYDVDYKKLNVFSWSGAGAEVSYEIPIEEEGLYHIALHYKNSKEDFSVFQSIKIDGKVPFEELSAYEFASTDSSWANEVLSDKEGIPYEIYLTKGTHIISFRSELEPVAMEWRYAKLISEHVSQFDLEIKKITGTNKDNNRTWKMTKYIPEIIDYLEAYETLIQHIKYTLQDYAPNGAESAVLSELDKVLEFTEKMKEYPDEIALYTENFTGRDNSVLISMGNFMTRLSAQRFSLDMIYVYGDQNLPKPNKGFFAMTLDGMERLLNSFTSKKYAVDNDPDVVNVWVNRAMTHVDLLQKMADTEFTPKYGIKVKISVMPDANKLTMAAAADETPDVALGIGSHIPFELATRGALYDFTKFPDFWKIADRFVPGAFVSYIYNEGVYAIPETLDFHALIYRKDIFNSLSLTPPDTWEDVTNMLPELQRYGMNFYHNISAGVGYKWFYQTSSLIYQNDGSLYTEDGLKTAIDEPNAVKGLRQLGNLFITYSLDSQVISFFNSFRYATLPVGIVNLEDYILIKNGAPELAEQWELSPYPGTVGEDGEIKRWYVANGSNGIIFNDTNKKEDAWEFLKWWTSHETQINYAYTLRANYGETFVWLSSNIDAVQDSPIDQKDKLVILDQIKWFRDVVRTPGQYLLERSISDIWNAMILDGKPAQVAIDEKVIDINREIKKKMKELGFYDDDGNLIKSYVIRDIDWIQSQIENTKKGEE